MTVLKKHYKPPIGGGGPSWLSFIGHSIDSLWSVDLFRSESLLLKSHWVMVIIDQFTRRIIGFATHQGELNGVAACVMFNQIISNKPLPKYLSSDNDPLFTFQRWRANLRVLDIKELKSMPYEPRSHPFVERVIGIIRQEFLNHIFFWNKCDLENKLASFRTYYNEQRAHSATAQVTPHQKMQNSSKKILNLKNYQWKLHARGIFQLPIAA